MSEYIKKISVYLEPLAGALKTYSKSAGMFFQTKGKDIKQNTTSSIQLVPSVIRKPSVLWRWLFTSHWFYISLIVAVLVMNILIDAAINKTLSAIYPKVKTEKFFGLVVQEYDDPRIIRQHKIIRSVLWAGVCGLNAYVLLLCLPVVVRKTARKARNKEAEADTMVTKKPSESILLYNQALKLAVDESHESLLKNKIENLDNAFKSGKTGLSTGAKPTTTPEKGATGTLVIPKGASDQSSQENVIGPEGRYRIERKLGQGAMGVVFLGKDQLLFRKVALKKLTAGQNQDQDLVTRFQQEARALARLSHPNIVQVYDFVQADNQYWIAMEYVEGKDLGTLIDENGSYALGEAAQLGIMIAEAMDYAHHRGVIHRDFKPSNVLMTAANEPKVMDFGLAKLTQSSIATVEGSLIGSPAFMSPEQAMGKKVDERSDIYALGVTLYQLLTGDLPFKGDLKSVVTQKIAGHQPSLALLESQMPAELVGVVRRMLSNDPDDRPAAMSAISRALQTVVHNGNSL